MACSMDLHSTLGAAPASFVQRSVAPPANAAMRSKGITRKVLHPGTSTSPTRAVTTKLSLSCHSPRAGEHVPGQASASSGGRVVVNGQVQYVQRAQHFAPTLLEQRRLQPQLHAPKQDQKQASLLQQPQPQTQRHPRSTHVAAFPRAQSLHRRVHAQMHPQPEQPQQARVHTQASPQTVVHNRSAPSPAEAHISASVAEAKLERTVDNEVVLLLRRCELDQHSEAFLSAGLDTLEALLKMDDVDVRELGIPRGHWLKIRKYLRDTVSKQSCTSSSTKSSPSKTDRAVPLPIAAPLSSSGSVQTKSDVQKSWEKIQEIGILHAGEILYKKIFELDPAARKSVPPEVLEKYRISSFLTSLNEDELDDAFIENAIFSDWAGKIFNVVGHVVAGQQKFGESTLVVTMSQELGSRHVGYGMPDSILKVVVPAFKSALHELLGSMLAEDLEHVWMAGLERVNSLMIQGMHETIARDSLN